MKVNNAPTISQLQKTLLELLKDRPRWTRFQNFDTEKSCDELEECLERIEFSVGGLMLMPNEKASPWCGYEKEVAGL